jgi:hypothetical protein
MRSILNTQTGHRRLAAVAVVAFMHFVIPDAASAEGPAIELSTGFDYSSGDYGTGVDTDILYIPVTARYETGSWIVGLTVPYIQIESDGEVVGGTDSPIVTKKKKKNVTGSERTTDSGLGDIVGALTYNILPGADGNPVVDLVGKVKVPTASEDDGLGTGEFDYTAQVDLSHSWGKFSPFATLGYRIIGEPSGTDLDNIFMLSLGSGYRISEQWSGGLALDYRQATTSAADDPLEVSPHVTWTLNDSLAVDLYALFGLSEGSPDNGGGLQFTVTF